MIVTRPILWVKAARRDFESFPEGAKITLGRALTIIAGGGHPDLAKPMAGLGSGVLELALRYRGEAYRLVYALQIGQDVWSCTPSRRSRRAGSRHPSPTSISSASD